VRVFNGSDLLAVAGRDKDATWYWLDDARRVPGWPGGRILDDIKARRLPWRGYVSGMGFVTSDTFYPDGSIEKLTADWERNELIIVVLDNQFHPHTVEAAEVSLPTDAEVPAPPADASKTLPASAQWAIAATRNLRAEGKTEGIKKAELGRLLEAQSEKAARAGQIRRALKASYLEDQLVPWGIWPLSSLK
jgi:hypothetical protein